MKRVIAAIAMIALILGLAACGSGSGDDSGGDTTEASSDEPLTLGFAIGETGFMEPFDVPAQTSAGFAIDDINADGGIDGRQVETVTADMKSKPELAGDAATKVLDDGADIVITSCDFDQGSPAAVVAQDQNKLAFSTCAASIAFGPQGIGPLAFTMATAGSAEGAAMAEWAYEDKDWRTAYTLLDDTIQFTKESVFGFEESWKNLGGKLLGSDTWKQTDQSIASQINTIKGLNPQPDFIYISSYMPGEASAVKQIRAAGLDMPLLGDEDLDGDYWKEAVPGPQRRLLLDLRVDLRRRSRRPGQRAGRSLQAGDGQDPRHLSVPDRLRDGRGDQERGRGRGRLDRRPGARRPAADLRRRGSAAADDVRRPSSTSRSAGRCGSCRSRTARRRSWTSGRRRTSRSPRADACSARPASVSSSRGSRPSTAWTSMSGRPR